MGIAFVLVSSIYIHSAIQNVLSNILSCSLLSLTNEGNCGWQGRMDELEVYQELRAKNHPAKMLTIADHWLRKELEESRKKRKFEKAQGEMAHQLDPTDRQGGYASGRNMKLEGETQQIKRERQLNL